MWQLAPSQETPNLGSQKRMEDTQPTQPYCQFLTCLTRVPSYSTPYCRIHCPFQPNVLPQTPPPCNNPFVVNDLAPQDKTRYAHHHDDDPEAPALLPPAVVADYSVG